MIVYQHTMDLWLYDIATGKNAQIPVQLPSDRLQVRRTLCRTRCPLWAAWGLSTDGSALCSETRGDIFVTRTKKKGLIRRITECVARANEIPGILP